MVDMLALPAPKSQEQSYTTHMQTGTSKRKSKQRLVTVCLANRARSPTAEWLLHRNYKVKSCGTAEFDATKPCDKWLMKWADRVLVMEPYQKQNLEMRFKEAQGKVEVLDVPEVGKYSCMPSLIEEIAQRLEEHHLKVRDIRNLNKASNECMQWTSSMAERKLSARGSRSYALTDFWKVDESKLEPWQIEERRAFQRASALPRGQGGISWVMEDEEEDDLSARIPDEDTFLALMNLPPRAKTAKKEKSQKKLTNELKKYADSVRKFFES